MFRRQDCQVDVRLLQGKPRGQSLVFDFFEICGLSEFSTGALNMVTKGHHIKIFLVQGLSKELQMGLLAT